VRKSVAKVIDPASKEKSIKWPQIFTADGVPMEFNALVYTCDYYEDKWDKKASAGITAYRITRIDLRYRTVRMRCAKGCETFLQLNQGCSIEKYYSSKEQAEFVLKEKIEKSVYEILEHIEKKKVKLATVKRLKVKMSKIPPVEVQP